MGPTRVEDSKPGLIVDQVAILPGGGFYVLVPQICLRRFFVYINVGR